MKMLNSKIFIGLICFGLGATGALLTEKLFTKPENKLPMLVSQTTKNNVQPLLDQFFNDDFFNRSRDPFEEMRKMRNRMMKDFDQPMGGGDIFDSWYKKRFGGGDAGEITKREDDHFIYYEISVKGVEQNKVNVKVENGQIDVSAQIEQKSDDQNFKSYTSSSFHRSFPTPYNVDESRMQMEQQKDKLVIKFPKMNGGR